MTRGGGDVRIVESVVQADAARTVGNSGGAVVNPAERTVWEGGNRQGLSHLDAVASSFVPSVVHRFHRLGACCDML